VGARYKERLLLKEAYTRSAITLWSNRGELRASAQRNLGKTGLAIRGKHRVSCGAQNTSITRELNRRDLCKLEEDEEETFGTS